jgi:hypothetical protein
MCTGNTGRDGLARVLEGFGLGGGAMWVGAGEATLVGNLQRGRGTERGGPGGVFPLLPCRTARVGTEGAGLDHGDVHEHGYRI